MRRKKGYNKRIKTQFIKSEVSDVLFLPCDTTSNEIIESLSQSISLSHRTIIPYFIEILNEWVLIIIDCNRIAHYVYARYADGVVSPSSEDSPTAFNLNMTKKLIC